MMKYIALIAALSLAACGAPTTTHLIHNSTDDDTHLTEIAKGKQKALNKSLIVDDSLMWH